MYSGLATFVADMFALSLVALSRCLDMIMVKKWTVFCSKKKNIFYFISIGVDIRLSLDYSYVDREVAWSRNRMEL